MLKSWVALNATNRPESPTDLPGFININRPDHMIRQLPQQCQIEQTFLQEKMQYYASRGI